MTNWKTVDVIATDHMNVPHVLQQKMSRDNTPLSEHRLLSINELHGIEK